MSGPDAEPRRSPATAPRTGLAGASLALAAALALALPPEVQPEAGPAVALLLAAGIVVLRPRLGAAAVIVGFSAACFNLGVSLSPGRTTVVLTRLLLSVGAFVLARAIPPAARKAPLWSIAGVGAALGLLAIAQKAFLLRLQARQLPADAPSVFAERLALGRPFGTLVTPAALAGALVLCLAAAGALAASDPRRRRGALALAAPAAVGLVLTGSVGAVLGVAAAAGVVAAPTFRRWSWRRWVVVGGAALALTAAVIAVRPGGELRLDRPDHPLRLRAGNWRGAVLLALEQPVAGVGLGAFGALYGRVRRPGDVETIYAHNSWLQLAVEGGLPAVVLLVAAALALWRCGRREDLAALERWPLAGAVAFAAHNLVDFTLYLPGVAIPAAVLAGLAFPDRRPGARGAGESAPPAAAEGTRRDPDGPRDSLRGVAWGTWTIVGALLLAAAFWFGEAAARRALEQADQRRRDGAPGQAVAAAARAPRWAPWDPIIGVEAGSLLLAAETPAAAGHDRSAALARRWTWLDPESPGPWRLAGDIDAAANRGVAAWWNWSLAWARHPADEKLGALVGSAERRLAAAGLLQTPLDYGGVAARPLVLDWSFWDALLLILHLVGLAFVVYRWRRPGRAPATGLALALVLLGSAWGEGGALPGVRLGRQLLIAGAIVAAMWPSRREEARRAGRAPRTPLALLAPALAWAAVSALLAPDRAAAADGLCALLAAAAIIVLSWSLSAELPAWPDVVLRVFAVCASLAGSIWLAQRAALALGVDVGAAPVPLRTDPLRPAGDFLHPGHLATYLIAAGLAVAGTALGARGRSLVLRSTLAILFVGTGAIGGARAALAALAAGGVVLALAAPRGRVRRVLVGLIVTAAVVAGAFVAHRFAAGSPFALSRVEIWKACLRAVADRPWTGAGPGGFASVARTYAFADPEGVARFGKFFEGPHSDLLGAFVGLGIPGGLMLLSAVGWIFWRAARVVRARKEGWPVHLGLLAAVTAMGAHALVDDLFAERPAAVVVAALCLGALAGRAAGDAPVWSLSPRSRIVCATVLATIVLAGELTPWLGDVARRGGDPILATRLDRRRWTYWVLAARLAGGAAADRFRTALDRTTTAVQVFPEGAEAWQERAQVLEAGCRGPLAEPGTCEAARDAWGRVIALRPANVFALHSRARLAGLAGDFASAADDARRALRLEPFFCGARLVLIRALADQGAAAEARGELGVLDYQQRRIAGRRPVSAYEQALLTLPPGDLESLRRRLLGTGTGDRIGSLSPVPLPH